MKGFRGGFSRLKFRRNFGGYTIIEVMIFLSVTAVLFTSTIFVYQGVKNQNQFSQDVQNTASKIQSYINDVGNSLSPYGSENKCTVSGSTGRPVVDPSGGIPQTDPPCIFVGRALHLNAQGGSGLYAYAIFGDRLVQSGPNAGLPISSLNEANIDPIFPAQGSSVDLSSHFLTPATLLIKSSKVTYTSDGPSQQTPSHNASLIGFYNDFSSTNNVSVTAMAYNCGATTACGPISAGVRDCIEQKPPDCASPQPIIKWQTCFANNFNNQTALLSVNISISISNQLDFVSC